MPGVRFRRAIALVVAVLLAAALAGCEQSTPATQAVEAPEVEPVEVTTTTTTPPPPSPPIPVVSTPSDPDWLDERGTALDLGSPTPELGQRLVGLAPTLGGYRIAADGGGVYVYGNASWEGDLNGTPLTSPVVGIGSTPDGRGYWLVTADGNVFNYGTAPALGSLVGLPFPVQIAGIAVAPSGTGFWLVAVDGGVFNFGDAGFMGSVDTAALGRPIVGMATTSTGEGYWLAAADGAVFAFGDAVHLGAPNPDELAASVVGITVSPSGNGYWLAANDGSVFTYGDAEFHGAAPSAEPAVAIVATGWTGYLVLHTSMPSAEGPSLPADSGTGRRIVYDNAQQRVWLVEFGDVVVRTYAVSGRRGDPNPGTYSVFSKSPKAWAGHDGITMNHMIRFARGPQLAIGFHAIPRYSSGRPLQSEDDLGAFRSAGCVRQSDADAAFLWEWAPVGTTVVVL